KIGKSKAVMNGDMIDAGARTSSTVVEQVGRAGHPTADIANQTSLPCPVAAHRSPIPIVPFRPGGWECTKLIASGTNVPGLCNQLHLGEHRILFDGGKERCAPIEAIRAPRKGARQVEAEAIDMESFHPMPQRIHDELKDSRMRQVESISAAG